MLKINTDKQIAIFENMVKNLSGEEIEVLTNFGGELFWSGLVQGMILGAIAVTGGVAIGMAFEVAEKMRKEKEDTKN